MVEAVGRSGAGGFDLMGLLSDYILASSAPEETKRLLLAHPELQRVTVDIALADLIEGAKVDGDDDNVTMLTERRWLLHESRRVGVHGAVAKRQTHYLVGRFLEASDPGAKRELLEQHPEIFQVGPVALHQMIEEAREAHDDPLIVILRSHLRLLVMSDLDGLDAAFAAAFGE